MSNYLIAVDPGLKTGLTIFNLDSEIPEMVRSYEMSLSEFQEYVELLDTSAGDALHHVEIVIEDFIITTETAKKSLGGNWSLENIGKILYVAEKHGISVKKQRPGDRMSISHEQLKGLDYWHVGGEGHANQASRHAVVYMLDTLKNKALARKLIDM